MISGNTFATPPAKTGSQFARHSPSQHRNVGWICDNLYELGCAPPLGSQRSRRHPHPRRRGVRRRHCGVHPPLICIAHGNRETHWPVCLWYWNQTSVSIVYASHGCLRPERHDKPIRRPPRSDVLQEAWGGPRESGHTSHPRKYNELTFEGLESREQCAGSADVGRCRRQHRNEYRARKGRKARPESSYSARPQRSFDGLQALKGRFRTPRRIHNEDMTAFQSICNCIEHAGKITAARIMGEMFDPTLAGDE
jgi:hypothetical protein